MTLNTFKEFLNKNIDNPEPDFEDDQVLSELITTLVLSKIISQEELDEAKKRNPKDVFGGVIKTISLVLQRKLLATHIQLINTFDLHQKLNLLSVQENINAGLNLLSIAVFNSNKSILSKVSSVAALQNR